jgi:cbb3-type cytochrome oxidase subunit 3
VNATIFSLLAVTFGFAVLVLWVYWPSRRNRLEALGRIPLDDADERNNKEKTS